MLPREHGSWVMLLVPPVLGWAAAGGGPAGAAALFALGTAGAFLLRTPLGVLLESPGHPAARRWVLSCAAAAAAGFGGLAALYGRWGLLLMVPPDGGALAVALRNQRRRRAMSEANELVGIAGLSLGAPAAWYAASGAWEPGAAWLWALCALFFSGPVFHVKMLVSRRAASARGAPVEAARRADGARRLSLAYHGAAAAAVAAAAAGGAVPAGALLPFGASAAKSAWWAARQGPGLELKKVGWQEVGWTALFLAVMLHFSR
ncbi:MAG: YwiC-like family protein [Elusimicrobia bacterium]|nr:YwiC-like family protein [Elusimicrobiota bacterium]